MTSKLQRSDGGIIYLIECRATGRKYVGKTSQPLYRRWIEHCYEARANRKDSPLYSAMREFGPDEFTCIVIASARDARELAAREEWWINALGTRETGLNARIGGGGRTAKLKGRRAQWDQQTKDQIRITITATLARKRQSAASAASG